MGQAKQMLVDAQNSNKEGGTEQGGQDLASLGRGDSNLLD